MDAAEVISSHGLFDIPHQQVHLRSSIIYIDHDVIHRQKRNAHISARESLFSLLMTADTEDRHPYAHHQHVSTMYTSSVDDVNSDDRSNSAVGGEDERKGSDDCDDNFSAALHPALGPIQASVSEIMSPSSSLLSVTALNLTHLAMHNQTTTNRQWLVHLKTPITQHIKDRVNAAIEPYTLGQYVPHNTFVVVGPNDFSFFNTLSRAPRVLHVTTYHHAFKPSPELMRGVYDNHYQQQQQQQRQRPHPHPLDQPQNKEDREYNNGADRAESQEYHSHENGDASNKVIINSTSNGVFSNSTNHDGGGRGGGGDNVTAEGEKTVVLLVRLSAEYYTSKTQVEELCQIWMSLFNACTNCTTNADTEDQQQQRRQGASLAAPASSTALVITALGEQLMQASVPLSILTHAVVFLSQRHEVHFLEQKKEFELQNKHAQWIIQSDEAGHTTFFDHRLDGQGEVVLIGDTGECWCDDVMCVYVCIVYRDCLCSCGWMACMLMHG